MHEIEIIALTGKSNTGKSETLNIVYQLMLLFGYTQVPGHFRVLGNPRNHDCIDILEKNGVRIGIAMMGDYEKYLKDIKPGDTVQDLLKYLESNGCAKTVCACNNDLKIALEFISKYTYHIVEKKVATNEALKRKLNGEDAEKLFKLI